MKVFSRKAQRVLTVCFPLLFYWDNISALPLGSLVNLEPGDVNGTGSAENITMIGELCKENFNNDNITNTKWYRFHNESQQCYHIDERGPCGELMLFYRVGDTQYGDCDCNFYYKCDRPLIYYEPDNRCYFVNDQGPCEEDEWFVFGKNLRPTCELNPCLTEQAVAPSTRKEFWFERLGECYRTNTIGYCANPEDILSVKWNEYSPSCNPRMTCYRNSRDSNFHTNSTSAPDCLPGQKQDQQGNCKRVVIIT